MVGAIMTAGKRLINGIYGISCAVVSMEGDVYQGEDEFYSLMNEEFPSSNNDELPPIVFKALSLSDRFVGKSIVVTAQAAGDFLFLKAKKNVIYERLSPREREIGELIAKGLNYKKIAIALNLAPTTVRNTIQRIHKKLGTHNFVELSIRMNDLIS
jgi:DNA-binding CsgD family transcriptional regulator